MSMLFRRKLSVILMIALVLSIFTGCGQSKTSKSANANSSQNIAQMGFVVQKDDWVYYLLLNSEEGKLYLHKVKTDGSENQPLFATDPVAISAFSVYGDWIYYQPMKAGNAEKEPIWRKMKLDGTQNAEFADLGSGGIISTVTGFITVQQVQSPLALANLIFR